MSQRFEVAIQDGCDDPRGQRVAAQAQKYLGLPIEGVRTRTVYKIGGGLGPQETEQVRQALTDPVVEESALGRLPLAPCDWVVRVGFRPGVTDNVGRTARVFIADLLSESKALEGPAVYTETLYLIRAAGLDREQIDRLGRELLANAVIERIDVWEAGDYQTQPLDLELPLAGVSREPIAETVVLPAGDADLAALSRSRTLALSLPEMHAIRAYYEQAAVRERRRGLGLSEHPTDVELECLAQTWSEHCKHKIFGARISYRDEHGHVHDVESLFKSYIVDATTQVGKRVDWLVSVFHDNAGVVRVAPDLNLVFKVETHNSPSALDPYGGAITGIVGVNRDPFGTGIGAELLTNTWGYCFGSPLYDGPLPEGLHHPRRIRDGVHHGVIDGGNQSGIPYSRGFELFDERYLGKPLVFCGTVGWMPREIAGGPAERKEISPGDIVVMVGGRIGKDGIHGATFSSEALHQESPAQAVQIGDAITQKMMTDMLVEARDRGLYRALTDNGAGGLSSSIGEMARLSGGAELDLEAAPLKYAGLMPWEILLSEAQERMSLAVPPEQLDELLALAKRREVEATPIGRFSDDGYFRLRYAGKVVGELSLDFLHEGCPVMELEAAWEPPVGAGPADLGIAVDQVDAAELLLDLLGGVNLCTKETRCRQYDHEVKGLSVIKPLVGVQGDVPSDASVMRIRHGDDHAVILSEAIAPRLSDLDPGAMAGVVVDLAVRRIVAAGGRLGQIAALDNFCWPDPVQSESTPDGRQKLAGLVRCCETLHRHTVALDLPLISGKDSMKNDSMRGGVKISIPPTLLLSVMGWIEDARRALDPVIDAPQRLLYLLGQTDSAMGACEAYALLGERSGQPLLGKEPPRSDPSACRSACAALESAVDAGLVVAAHAPHAGGLALGCASLCLAAGLGVEVALDRVPETGGLGPFELLFSETPSRLLVAVAAADGAAFEQLVGAQKVPFANIGTTTDTGRLTIRAASGSDPLVDLPLASMGQRFRGTLRD